MRKLAVDPRNPETAYAGSDAGLFKTTDGGQSWAESSRIPPSYMDAIAIAPSSTSTVYVGTASRVGGVFKSTDAGASWRAMFNGFPADTAIGTVAVSASSPDTIYAGTALVSTPPYYAIWVSSDGGSTWKAAGDGFPRGQGVWSIAVDPTSPKIAYMSSGSIWKNAGVYKTTDMGATWAPVGLTTENVTKLAIDPLHPETVYAGTYGSGVYRSTDGGATWTQYTQGLPPESQITALAIDPTNTNTIYAGLGTVGETQATNDITVYFQTQGYEGVFKSTDGGQTWLPMTAGLEGRWVKALAVDPSDGQTVYAGIHQWIDENAGGVFKSANGGLTWNRLNEADVTALAIDPANPRTVYAGAFAAGGTFLGTGGTWKPYSLGRVLVSTDGGATWESFNDGLPERIDGEYSSNLNVYSLAIDRTGTRIHAGTYGRGVYDYSTVAPDLVLTPADLSLSTEKVVGGDRVTITARVGNAGTADASNVTVSFAVDGAVIASPVIDLIPAGGVGTASATWDTKHQDGEHVITVTADPANAIAELDETNNQASMTVLVRGNKVRNASFEESSSGTSPDHWSGQGQATYVAGGSDGQRAVSAGPGGSWTSEEIPVEAGRAYGVSVDLTGAGGTLVVEQLSASGAVVSALTTLLPAVDLGVFQTAAGGLTVVEGVVAVRVKLLGGLTGTSTFDRVRLWQE